MRGCVIFDMDGVLIDSQPFHYNTDMAIIKAAGAEPVFADVRRLAGVALKERCSAYKQIYGLSLPLDGLMRMHVSILMKMFRESDLGPINGIPELLILLKNAGVKTAVASSSSLALIRLVLDKLRISEFFDALITGEDIPNSKPAPDIFLAAAQALRFPPENCAAVEDSANGVLAVKRAGMYCVAYQNPSSGEQDLSPADMIIHSFHEIYHNLDWLKE